MMLRLAAALLAAGGAAAQTATRAEQAADAIAALAEQALAAQKIPGLTVAVRAADGSAWSRGFGLADVENRVSATADTSYRLASISKPMTAVVVMKLAEQGRLDLDADVSQLVPEFPAKRWPVTPRLLLGHLGGVRHYRGRGETLVNRHYEDVVAPLAIFAADPLLHEPGTKYRYTTYGYNLLGAAARNAAGERFDVLLARFVFEPAEMTATRVDDAHAIVPHRAQGYRLVRGELRNAHPVDTSNKVPGGGLCGTASDLVRFGVAMLDDRLVKRETRDAMWTAQRTAGGESTGYGLGFGVGSSKSGGRHVGHGGSQPRVQTVLRIWPDRGDVVAIMCNLQGAKLDKLVSAIGSELREQR